MTANLQTAKEKIFTAEVLNRITSENGKADPWWSHGEENFIDAVSGLLYYFGNDEKIVPGAPYEANANDFKRFVSDAQLDVNLAYAFKALISLVPTDENAKDCVDAWNNFILCPPKTRKSIYITIACAL